MMFTPAAFLRPGDCGLTFQEFPNGFVFPRRRSDINNDLSAPEPSASPSPVDGVKRPRGRSRHHLVALLCRSFTRLAPMSPVRDDHDLHFVHMHDCRKLCCWKN